MNLALYIGGVLGMSGAFAPPGTLGHHGPRRTARPVGHRTDGFNDWNAFGCKASAQLLDQTADALVADEMATAGYWHVNVIAGRRPTDGSLVADPEGLKTATEDRSTPAQQTVSRSTNRLSSNSAGTFALPGVRRQLGDLLTGWPFAVSRICCGTI